MVLGDVQGRWPDTCRLVSETTSSVGSFRSFKIADATVFTAVLRVHKRFLWTAKV
jgi:hypothetical protein